MRHARSMILPCVLCAVTLAIALVMACQLAIDGTDVFWGYLRIATSLSVIAFLFWLLFPPIRGPIHRPLSPFQAMHAVIRERGLVLLLPLFVMPAFMTGFTVIKTSFPFLVEFRWDGFWADADLWLFGVDPWRITHQLLGSAATRNLTFIYTVVWALAFGFGLPLYALSASPGQAIRAYAALMASWLAAGVGGAILFASAGPVFVDLVDASLAQRFAPFHQSLASLLPADNIILLSQQYLRHSFGGHHVVRAAGISAMPSMHLAVCTVLVILAWRSAWRFPAILLWAAIWVGSIHFGYHYALDGVVGSAIAWLCWRATAPRKGRRSQMEYSVLALR